MKKLLIAGIALLALGAGCSKAPATTPSVPGEGSTTGTPRDRQSLDGNTSRAQAETALGITLPADATNIETVNAGVMLTVSGYTMAAPIAAYPALEASILALPNMRSTNPTPPESDATDIVRVYAQQGGARPVLWSVRLQPEAGKTKFTIVRQ